MIIRGGENIYCVEIENRLVEPTTRSSTPPSSACPTPSSARRSRPSCRSTTARRSPRTTSATWVRGALADFKVPTYVELRTDKLPRNASGKLLKNALRGVGEVSFEETM